MLPAASPFLFGLLLDRVGIGALGLSAGLCLAAFGSLFLLCLRRADATHPSPAQGSGAKSLDDAIVQVGSSPPTVGRLAAAKLNATDRLSLCKWRVLSAVCSV
jgi:hypothetical protein